MLIVRHLDRQNPPAHTGRTSLVLAAENRQLVTSSHHSPGSGPNQTLRIRFPRCTAEPPYLGAATAGSTWTESWAPVCIAGLASR